MTIAELEQHIKEYGSLMAAALMQYELTGCLADRWLADGYRMSMEALIAERVKQEAHDGR